MTCGSSTINELSCWIWCILFFPVLSSLCNDGYVGTSIIRHALSCISYLTLVAVQNAAW